jgi:hypothetical protein
MPLIKKVGVPLTPLGDAAHEIAAHLVSELARLKRIARGCFGKAGSAPIRKIAVMLQLALVFELGIVHFPKQPAAPANSGLSAAISPRRLLSAHYPRPCYVVLR